MVLVAVCLAAARGIAHPSQAETGPVQLPAMRNATSVPGQTLAHERVWWALQQRAYPLKDIPEGAQQRALRQIRWLRARRSAAAELGEGDRWVSIGPAPIMDFTKQPVSGRVAAVAVDPSEPRHWLIGAAAGGIWETRDAGTTWLPKTDDQASLAFGAVTFAPSDPRIIYAGTGEANFRGVSYAGQGLLKSTDGGASWTALGSTTFARTAFSDIRVDPDNPAILVAATARGTVGRGAGWRLSPEDIEPPLAASPRGVFVSADGGVTWSQPLDGEATDLEVDPGVFANQYAGIGEIYGGTNNGVYRSMDAGQAWALIDGPWRAMAGGVGRVEMALAPSNPSVLYVSIQDALDGLGADDGGLLGLFRTDNAWDAVPDWVKVDVDGTDDGTGTHGYCGWDPLAREDDDRCWYNHEVVVDPTSADVLYAGGNGLWRFDGATWREIGKVSVLSPRSIHSDQHAMVWAGDRLIVGNDGGVWSTTDAGTTWVNHNATLAITQFYKGALHPVDPNFALGGNQDNGFVKWTGTDAWRFVYFADGMETAIAARNPDTHWGLAFQFLSILRTRNGPLAPLDVVAADAGIDKTGAPFIARMEKCPAGDDVFIAGTDNLWKSTNFFSGARASWSANGPEMGECAVGGSMAGCITALAFGASDATCGTYAFGTGDGRLMLTADGGGTWTDVDAGNAVPDRFVTDLAFDPQDAGILYVTLSGFDEGTPSQPGHVFKTTNAMDAAPAWSDVSPPVNLPQNTIAVDPVDSNLVYAGADMGVWKSTDGGGVWVHMGAEVGMPNVPVFDLQIHPAVRRPFAFTHGRGAFVLACRSDAECDDQKATNGSETCDLPTGRCQSAAALATATPTRTASATRIPSATAVPTVTPTATAAPSSTRSATATFTASPSPLPAATHTATPTRTASPIATPSRTTARNGGGCSIAPARPAAAISPLLTKEGARGRLHAGGLPALLLAALLLRARR